MRISLIVRPLLFFVAATVALPAATESPMLEVGSAAPSLQLPAANGSRYSLAENDGAKVLIFYRGLW